MSRRPLFLLWEVFYFIIYGEMNGKKNENERGLMYSILVKGNVQYIGLTDPQKGQ